MCIILGTEITGADELAGKMTTRTVQDQNLEKHMEKQMGCMTGFFQLFDRNQLLTGKRLYTTKRLPSSVVRNIINTLIFLFVLTMGENVDLFIYIP